MRILTKWFIERYRNKILNIHPSLLPKYKGASAIKDAFMNGEKTTGCTVHIVDENLDSGRIIAQRKVDISESDTLESLTEKIHKEEHILYPSVIEIFCRN